MYAKLLHKVLKRSVYEEEYCLYCKNKIKNTKAPFLGIKNSGEKHISTEQNPFNISDPLQACQFSSFKICLYKFHLQKIDKKLAVGIRNLEVTAK